MADNANSGTQPTSAGLILGFGYNTPVGLGLQATATFKIVAPDIAPDESQFYGALIDTPNPNVVFKLDQLFFGPTLGSPGPSGTLLIASDPNNVAEGWGIAGGIGVGAAYTPGNFRDWPGQFNSTSTAVGFSTSQAGAGYSWTAQQWKDGVSERA